MIQVTKSYTNLESGDLFRTEIDQHEILNIFFFK